MKNKLKMIFILVFSVVLSNCVMYRPPTSGSTATISFPGSSGISGYSVGILENPYTCEKMRLQPSETFKIPAGKLFTFLATYQTDFSASSVMTTYSFCRFMISFIPDKNQRYVVYLNVEKNKHCYISVREKLDSKISRIYGSNELPVEVKKRKLKTGLWSSYCADKISASKLDRRM